MDTRKAVYTFCDYKNEEICQKALLKTEVAFTDFHMMLSGEIQKQREIIDKLWVLVQRYSILNNGVPCYTTYPKSITDRVGREILSEIHENMKAIRKSNGALQCALGLVEQSIENFDASTKCLDYRTESPFTQGNQRQKPIFYYIEIVHDIYSYFRKVLAKLKFGANVIRPTAVTPIETYKKLLEPSEELDEFVKFSLCVCKCAKIN